MSDAVRGRIFDVQRFSIHDGPGIRTTVFMKGCPLRCPWCHNPESVFAESLLSFLAERCVGCGYCFRACRHGAHQMVEGVHRLDRMRCHVCGNCARECYAGAVELAGREATVAEVLDEVLCDRPFYETSGGGMTLSGGEPLQQIEFASALLRAAKGQGLHTCVETCGYAEFDCFEQIFHCTDLFLYDIKETDDVRHREQTGASNELILDNLRALHDRGANVHVRAPLIPGVNQRPDHLEALARIAASLPNLLGVEIMPYHRLGSGKRQRFGLPDNGPSPAPPDRAAVAQWCSFLKTRGIGGTHPWGA